MRLCVFLLLAQAFAAPPWLDWKSLRNPILAVDDRMLKDASVVYRDGMFYVFPSMRLDDSDARDWSKEWWFYKSPDLRNWRTFRPDGLRAAGKQPESPDVSWLRDRYYMVFQWPDPERQRRLYWSESVDLESWKTPREIAPDFEPKERVIDGALAWDSDGFHLGLKVRQKFYMLQNAELNGSWKSVEPASAAGEWAENYQFLKLDGVWKMVATDGLPAGWEKRGDSSYTSGHEPFLYTLGDWTHWLNKKHLNVPFEDWNKRMHANSAYLCDWRKYDGYYYLFFAGSNDDVRFARRGHGKIGVARSRDLSTWRLPGDTGP